jgi:peptidoglycan hydrolase-like protein with peptidoglycan-binding domain
MARNRITVLSAVLATAVATAIGAWIIARKQIESPADMAARTAPPSPSPILVPVEKRVLSSDIVTRGTVRFGLPQPISIPPSLLKASAGLIATLPLRNAQFEEGSVLLTASGRPVFVLQGQIPAYRDLGPGMSGEDVRQLEQGLKRLGFNPGAVDGIYDHQTAAAVEKWYRSSGWEPFGPTREQLANVRAIEQASGDVTRSKLAAVAAVEAAGLAVAAAGASADHNVRVAESSATAADPRRQMEDLKKGAALAAESARANAEFANAAAVAALNAQIAERALIVLDPRQPESALAAADAKLQLAQATLQKTRLEGQIAVREAERTALLAPERLELAEAAIKSARLEGEKAVRVALDTQKLAEFDAKIATRRADQLAGDLQSARKKLGVQVPVDEVVFIPRLPVRVEEVKTTVGHGVTGLVMLVTDNQLAVDSSLPLETAPLIKTGMKVAIDEQALGVDATGVITHVAGTPGTHGLDGYHVYFEVRVDPTPTRLEGISVRLTIPTQSTDGPVTAVPISAVSLAADGTSRVQIQNGDTLVYTVVKPGLSTAGYVQVTPVDGKLEPGQLVVVGYKNVESADPKLSEREAPK